MKTIKELKNIIDRFYAKYHLTSEVENILLSCGASEDDSSEEGYYAGMTNSQIRTCYSRIRDLIRYHHENKNPEYFTANTLIDFDLPDLVVEESFSIYERMNKIDDLKSLNEEWNVRNPINESKRSVSRVAKHRALRRMKNEDFTQVGTYPYMYISNTGDEYEYFMTDEEIDNAYNTNTFTDKMWLKGEAHITKEGGSYQVSWGDFDDYHEASSISACKAIVKKYHPYGFKWVKDDRSRPSQSDKRISTKLKAVREKVNSRLYRFVKINNIYKELDKLKREDTLISPAIYVGLEDRIRPLDINVREDDQRTLLPYTDKITSGGKIPSMGIVMYHRKGVEIPPSYVDRLHKIFYDNITSRDYFRYVGVGERLGSDTLLYQLCLPDELTDEINNTALAECGLGLVDNKVVEINMIEKRNKVDDDKSLNERWDVKNHRKMTKLKGSCERKPISECMPILEEVGSHGGYYVLGYHNNNEYVFWTNPKRFFCNEDDCYTNELTANVMKFQTYEQADAHSEDADEQYRKSTGYDEYYVTVEPYRTGEYVIVGAYENTKKYWNGSEWLDSIDEECIMSERIAKEEKRYVDRRVSNIPMFKPIYVDSSGNLIDSY